MQNINIAEYLRFPLFKDTIRLFLFFAILTCSFDIFLTFEVEGFTLRAAQLLLIPSIFFIISSYLFINKRPSLPIGIEFLILWTIFIIIFIPNTQYLARSFGYAFWLIFNSLIIIAFTFFFNNRTEILKLLKFYILSFFLISLFGLIQFIFPLLGLPAPLVEQWWFNNLARINGFSYEPSYFASYILMGWVFTAHLWINRIDLIRRSYLNFIFFILTITMLLTTSRMGWLLMILYLSFHFFTLFIQFITTFKIGKTRLIFFLLFSILGVALVAFVFIIGVDDLLFLIQGLGFAEEMSGASQSSTTHSISPRWNTFIDTITVFRQSPFLGYSLGGVASAIGNLRGDIVLSSEIAKDNEAMSVFMEVLGASGIFGFIPFLAYIFIIVKKPLKIARSADDKLLGGLLKALVIALIFELIILQFNQNILRLSLWIHIAILSALYSVVVRRKDSHVLRFY